MKIVNKPWGKEGWLAYPPEFPYVMKKIRTFKGNRSSLHVHKEKIETNYIIWGKAKVLIDGEEKIYETNETFSILPNQEHRITALDCDLTTIEVSTPQVDDVVRLQDDTGRGNGRIESEHK